LGYGGTDTGTIVNGTHPGWKRKEDEKEGRRESRLLNMETRKMALGQSQTSFAQKWCLWDQLPLLLWKAVLPGFMSSLTLED
jgi:hypothetical protein